MDGESGSTSFRRVTRGLRWVLLWTSLLAIMAVPLALAEAAPDGVGGVAGALPWRAIVGLIVLLGFSAFFSASEVAFSSLHAVRIRGMAEESGITGPLIARMMQYRNRVLYTILLGNMIVNVLISVILPVTLNTFFHEHGIDNDFYTGAGSVLLAAMVLVFFGEITPKILAERISEPFCRAAVLPLRGIDRLLSPIRWGVLRFTEFLFRITRFNDIKPAPFITDEEFRSVLTDSEERGVIESEEGQMIQGILTLSDQMLREILVPRPDVIALEHTATAAQALALFKEHEFSRIPLFEEDLDHISSVLFAKDLLPKMARGETDIVVSGLAHRCEFVPETMSVRDFVRFAQRHRVHLAVVVDEYGGTAGIVTLEDAIEEVVGEIHDENEQETVPYQQLRKGVYRVEGGMPLDDLSELLDVAIEHDEHETVAGFFIDSLEKMPETGDTVQHDQLLFTVEQLDGKRIETLLVESHSQQLGKEAS